MRVSAVEADSAVLHDRRMPPIRFTGECWIADANRLPDLTDGHFGEGWSHIGRVDRDQREFWKQIKSPSRRTVGFYIAVHQDHLTELPQRFWLGVEWLTDQLYVATGPTVPRPLAQRPPEPHPGDLRRPFRYLSAHATAARNQALFERVR